MTLRIMLLGLVASMGIELPSGADVSSWTQSGRDWVAATWLDLPGSCVEADRPDAAPTDCHQASKPTESPVVAVAEDCGTSDDMVFEAVSEGMAADFSADLLSMQAEESPDETAPVMLSSDETPTVGLPDGEESMTLAVPADEAEAVETDEDMVEPDEETSESHSCLDRVSSAVRLTREAVQAWASLIQEPAEEGCASY